MTFERKLIRGGLLAAAALAISLAIIALGELGGRSPAAWTAVAAALAVLASLASAWTAQRVVELQEKALAPNLRASLDLRTRYQLAQFRVANRGGSPAYNVRIEWDNQLQTVNRRPVEICPNGVLPVLIPGEEASIPLGTSNDFLTAYPQTTWAGTIHYVDAAGERQTTVFMLTAEHERQALVHNAEEPRTQFELQKIPDRLEDITQELARLRQILEKTYVLKSD
jgi:hypothetical protein